MVRSRITFTHWVTGEGRTKFDKRARFLKRAKTESENRYNIGGGLKRKKRSPSLPKMPWDNSNVEGK